MPVKQTWLNMMRMTMWKSKSSKCEKHDSAFQPLKTKKNPWNCKVLNALTLQSEQKLTSALFVPECTRTNLRPWRDNCSSYTKVTTVLTRAAATLAVLQSVLLSDLGDGQTQVQYEKMSLVDVFFLVIPFFPFIFFFFFLYRDPAGIPKEDEKAGPAVQREASKCRQAKKIPSVLSYWCIHADLVRSLSLWAGRFCSFALSSMGQRINRALT